MRLLRNIEPEMPVTPMPGTDLSQVTRLAAVMPEAAASVILGALADQDVLDGGCWLVHPTSWQRYDRPWNGPDCSPGDAQLVGGIDITYGTPTRYDITMYRATVSALGAALGWTVTRLCDDALSFGGLTLETCLRANLLPPPPPFRRR